MSIQHLPKKNKTLDSFGIQNPVTPADTGDFLFSIDYHHNILKSLSTLRDMKIIRGYLHVFVELLGNKDLLLLSKNYDKYLIVIHENFNSHGLHIKIFLGKDGDDKNV